MAAGLVMALIGTFVLLRTIVKDASGKNLVDRLLSL